MKRLKTLIIALSLSLALVVPASAFAPLIYLGYVVGAELAPYVAAAAVLHVSAAAAGIWYYMKPTSISPTVTDATGNVYRKSEAQWIDLTLPTPAVVTKPITAVMTDAQLRAIVEKDAASKQKYPLLDQSFNMVVPYPPLDNAHMPTAVGNKYTGSDGNSYNVTSRVFQSGGGCSQSSNPDNNLIVITGVSPNKHIDVYDRMAGNYNQYISTLGQIPAPVPNPVTPAQHAAILSTAGMITVVAPATPPILANYNAEMDKAFQDPDYVPVFTDDTTGLPYSPPLLGNVATPAQVTAYNATGNAAAAASTAVTSAAAAATAAANTATAAGAAAATANAAAAASPGDPGLAAAAATATLAANRAGAAAAGAQAAADKLGAEQAATASAAATEAAKSPDNPATIPLPSAVHTLDFTPLDAVKNAMSTTYPFNLPTSISTYYARLAGGAGTAPAFDLPMPGGNTLHCDMVIFDPVAKAFRFVFGVIISGGCLFYIVHFYRGIS